MPHQKVFFCHVQYFYIKNWKTTQYNLSKNVCFSFSTCFVFSLLSNNTLHEMFCTYNCYWNTFQYKYIIQITFHVMCEWFQKTFIYSYHIIYLPISVLSRLRFISWSSPSQALLKSKWKFLHALKAFPNVSSVCFHWKITWHLGKANKKVKTERVSNWIDAQSSCLGLTSFNVPSCWLPKTTDYLLL